MAMDEEIAARLEESKTAKCYECRVSEHGDFDPIVGLCSIKDPDSGKIILRAYLCEAHVGMRMDDGYLVYLKGRKLE